MSRLQSIIEQIQFVRAYTISFLDKTPESDWFRIPPAGVTHIGWQVGHLAFAQYRLALERIRDIRPEDAQLIPVQFFTLFGRDSKPSPDESIHPTCQEIRDVFDRVHDQTIRELKNLDEPELDKPVLKPHPLVKTKFWSLLWSAHHESIHTGQIGLIRRQLGHAPIW